MKFTQAISSIFMFHSGESRNPAKRIQSWIPAFAGMTLFLLLIPGQLLHAAEISVTANRNSVTLEESFQVIFSSGQEVDDEPDFSPLEKDFEILGTQQSSKISFINGVTTSEKQWIVTLLPKHSGKITIPAISFGKDRSQPATITVKQSGDDREKGREIFIEIETDPEEVYVQQQISVTVRVFRSISVANEKLSSLKISGVNSFVEQLADDRNYRTRVDERLYNVYERHYVLYPQESGLLTVNPIRYNATTGISRFFADPFGDQPKSVVRRSEELKVTVKPVPAGFSGQDWLPAKSLELEETWSQDPPEFRVGEPITRTITLSGRGLMASQLPELSPGLPDTFKAYPDQPVLKNESLDRDIVGIREEKIAVIPATAGRYTLPAIRIPYWSVSSETMSLVELPERSVEVLPALTGKLPVQPSPQPTAPPVTTNGTATVHTQPEVMTVDRSTRVWQWISGSLLVVWMLTLWFWWRSTHRPMTQTHGEESGRPEQKLKAVQQACRDNNPYVCKQALLHWAAARWRVQPPRSLGEISRRLDPVIQDEFDKLNNVLYNTNQTQWDGDRFWQVFNEAVKNSKPESDPESGALEPMFRIS